MILDNLIAQGKAVPMVMVDDARATACPTGRPARWRRRASPGYTKSLLDRGHARRSRRRTTSRRTAKQRAIAGLSMGGAETLYTGLNNLDKFAWIGVVQRRVRDVAARPIRRLRRLPRLARRQAEADAAGAARGRRFRKELPGAGREGGVADQDAVDRLRDRGLADRRQPAVQGVAEVEGHAVHRSWRFRITRTCGRSGGRTWRKWRSCFSPTRGDDDEIRNRDIDDGGRLGAGPGAAPAQPGRGGRGPQGPVVVSPEVTADKKVIFRILAPKAQAVRLAGGDIPGRRSCHSPRARTASGR